MTLIIFLGTLLSTIAIGIPIAFSLLISAIALMWHMDLFDAQILAQNVINGADSFPLLAVPFFMLAGEIMNSGGLSRRIVNLALALIGHLKGGLGYVTILAGCLVAALSGSAVADSAALTAMLLPMMIRAGYEKGRSGGLLAASAVIAPVLPPSIGFVVFGVTANVSISQLFMAGIAPGIMMGVALWITWWMVSRKSDLKAPPRKSRAEVLQALRDSLWALMLPVIILVGLRMGVFTPTEAAVVAAVYSLFVATVIYRELTFKQLIEGLASAAKTSAIIMFLVAGAIVTAWLITVADLPSMLIDLLEPFLDSPRTLLVATMLLVLLIGTVMDLTPAVLILSPVLMPVMNAAGINPVYFGVLFIMNMSISLLTPPVGTVLNVVAGVGQIRMESIIRGVTPFLLAHLVVLALLVLFPELVMTPLRWINS